MDRPALEQRSAIPQKIQENLPENRNVGEDSGEDEDYPIPADQIKPRLCECLDNARSTSADSFACYEGLKNAPNPALSIRDHGSIRFPLSDQDIEKIITASVLSRTQVKIKKRQASCYLQLRCLGNPWLHDRIEEPGMENSH
jgi:hypothetical protein